MFICIIIWYQFLSQAPGIITGLASTPIAATTAILSWDHLPDNLTNGDLFGYVVRVKFINLRAPTTSLGACLQENNATMDRNISVLTLATACTLQREPITLQVGNIGEPVTM